MRLAVVACLLVACSSTPPAPIVPIPPPADAHLTDAALPSTAPLTQLALGGAHTCALHADGTVSCWGSNAHLELGVTDAGDIAHPIRVPGVAHASQISAGDGRTCILRDSGQVACWGALDNTSSEAPMDLPLPPIAQIASDCLRTRDGAVMCWAPHGGSPVQIANVADARDVANFYSRGCAIIGDDGGVACWGLDDEPWTDKIEPAKPVDGVTGATRVAVGADFACALLRDGHVSCWGVESGGQLGRGRLITREPPVTMRYIPPTRLPPGPVANLGDATAIAARGGLACALRATGAVVCWGSASNRLEPITSKLSVPTAKPTEVLTGATALAASTLAAFASDAELGHFCAITGPRAVSCWGSDQHGQLGNGWTHARTQPIDVPDVDDAIALWPTDRGACAVRTGGKLACWRPARYDVSGVPAIADASNGGLIEASGAVWDPERGAAVRIAPAVAASHRCAVTRDGKLWCWVQTDRTEGWPLPDDAGPRPVKGVTDAIAVADGGYRSCALRKSGAVTCVFGWEFIGLYVNAPFDIPGLANVTHYATGSGEVDCAIVGAGDVTCVKYPPPDLSTSERPPYVTPKVTLVPIDVHDAVAIAVGYNAACAVRKTGDVTCWGGNESGQLGDGTRTGHGHPSAVLGLHDARAIELGFAYACALHGNGRVACWGDAGAGAVGTYATKWIEPPVAVTW